MTRLVSADDRFLAVYRADRSMRTIIDPRQVDDAIRYQARKLAGEKSEATVLFHEEKHLEGPTIRQDTKWEVEPNPLGTVASFFTKVTSFSTTTEVVANKD